jgi:hypothetical protein
MKLTTALLCLAGVLSAQPAPAPNPVIQTETREVLVDAIVTAKNGTYIRDLTAKDFHLSQDGKEQTIWSCFSTKPAWNRGIRLRSARLPPALSMPKRERTI